MAEAADVTQCVTQRDILLELDTRRRLPLAKLARGGDDRYLADVHADGTIVLRPAKVMTEIQLRFLANPDVMAQVAASQAAYKADPSRGNRTRGIPARRGA
jgi:hypothetical protein